MALQLAEDVPAVKHAAIAVSELYQGFGNIQGCSKTTHTARNVALGHYNRAIHHMMSFTNANHDTALLVCVLFICMEFLLGHASEAIAHVVHGSRLLASGHDSRLAPIFRHLLVFPFFFARSLPPHLTVPGTAQIWGKGALMSPSQAQAALDLLSYEVVKLVRMTDYSRIGASGEGLPHYAPRREQLRLRNGLRQWGNNFSGLKSMVESNAHRSSLCLLEVRWLILSIWVDTCLAQDEMVYDHHQHRFERILHLANTVQRPADPKLVAFSFVMGYSPLLHFVVIKCRHLVLRLRALALLKSLSCDRESLWDKDLLYATGKRIVELEHGVEVPADLNADFIDSAPTNAVLPIDERRIRDNMLEGDREVLHDDSGAQRIRQKVCFLMRNVEGDLQQVCHWVVLSP